MKNKLTAGRPSAGKSKTLADLADKKPISRVTFNLDSQLHSELKMYAVKNDTNVTDILTEYIKSIVK